MSSWPSEIRLFTVLPFLPCYSTSRSFIWHHFGVRLSQSKHPDIINLHWHFVVSDFSRSSSSDSQTDIWFVTPSHRVGHIGLRLKIKKRLSWQGTLSGKGSFSNEHKLCYGRKSKYALSASSRYSAFDVRVPQTEVPAGQHGRQRNKRRRQWSRWAFQTVVC